MRKRDLVHLMSACCSTKASRVALRAPQPPAGECSVFGPFRESLPALACGNGHRPRDRGDDYAPGMGVDGEAVRSGQGYEGETRRLGLAYGELRRRGDRHDD